MNNFFERLSLPLKLLLLILFPIALIVYLSFEIYNERSEKSELFKGYLTRINQSADISALIIHIQVERRHSFAFALKKDIDSRSLMEMQRPLTDLALKKLDSSGDSALKKFRSYTFLDSLEIVRSRVSSGILSADLVMHYYTTAIFRLNTLNLVPAGNNKYLKPVFDDLNAARLLNEMSTYLGIIRANFYNALYTKHNNIAMLFGLLGTYDVYKSYEREFLAKASPETQKRYITIRNETELQPTIGYIDQIFKKFSFDTLFEAESWWNVSGLATDRLRTLQNELITNVRSRMNSIYNHESKSLDRTLIFLIVALVFVFALMLYTTNIINKMLSGLNMAAQKIAKGGIGVNVQNVSKDVIGSLGESIVKIDETNKELADAANAIGKGNFNVPLSPRSKEDIMGNAIIRMKDNLKRFTMEIEKTREEFRLVADTAPVMIWMTNEDKHCSFVNKEWLKFTGRRSEQEMGYGWIEGMHPDDYSRCAEVFDDAFNAREKYHLEYRFRRHDGEYRWLTETGDSRFSAEGIFEGYIGTCIDIHEMKIHEKRKDDFIKMASHELKTPVTSIKGYVQLLLSMYKNENKEGKLPLNEQVRYSLATIDRQIIKLNRLMSELLDLSRIDTGKLELNLQNFNLNELIEEIVQDIQLTTEHVISFKSDSVYTINGDKDRIAQVIQNLLTNAIKYSPRNKEIAVRTHRLSERTVAVSVIDHGIGIDKDQQDKVFERFYRVEGKSEQTYPGFGIGLFIASEIVQRHNGTIAVESEKGKGSTFTFILPTV